MIGVEKNIVFFPMRYFAGHEQYSRSHLLKPPVAVTELGARRVEDLLSRILFGIPA